jgi:hypothetical protein
MRDLIIKSCILIITFLSFNIIIPVNSVIGELREYLNVLVSISERKEALEAHKDFSEEANLIMSGRTSEVNCDNVQDIVDAIAEIQNSRIIEMKALTYKDLDITASTSIGTVSEFLLESDGVELTIESDDCITLIKKLEELQLPVVSLSLNFIEKYVKVQIKVGF